jgi:hypothetical protein
MDSLIVMPAGPLEKCREGVGLDSGKKRAGMTITICPPICVALYLV